MRTRHQDGWVEESGGRNRRWYGHYFVYEINKQGKETRRHRGVNLGEKSKLRKWAAEEKLREIIEKNQKKQPVGNAVTLEWFTRERFLPMRSPNGHLPRERRIWGT